PLQWRFDATPGADPRGGPRWEAGPGVEGLEVRDGRLRGRTTSPLSIVHLSRRPPADGSDVLEEIQVRLRASAGANLAIALSGQEEVDLARVAVGNNPVVFPFTTPIIAGAETRTYVLTNARGIPLSRARHVLLRPSDVDRKSTRLNSSH